MDELHRKFAVCELVSVVAAVASGLLWLLRSHWLVATWTAIAALWVVLARMWRHRLQDAETVDDQLSS